MIFPVSSSKSPGYLRTNGLHVLTTDSLILSQASGHTPTEGSKLGERLDHPTPMCGMIHYVIPVQLEKLLVQPFEKTSLSAMIVVYALEDKEPFLTFLLARCSR
jgi:hypothetical protein